MDGTFWFGNIDKLDARRPAGDERHIAREGDPRSQLDRIVMAKQDRRFGTPDVNDEKAIFPSGYIGHATMDLDLPSVPQTVETANDLRRSWVRNVGRMQFPPTDHEQRIALGRRVHRAAQAKTVHDRQLRSELLFRVLAQDGSRADSQDRGYRKTDTSFPC